MEKFSYIYSKFYSKNFYIKILLVFEIFHSVLILDYKCLIDTIENSHLIV